jgi:short-subunit dehydrogenase
MDSRNAIIIGASSGIGRALAKILVREGYRVGLAARRMDLLSELQRELGSQAVIKQIDVSHPAAATTQGSELLTEMNGAELIVLSAGTGFANPDLDWDKESETIAVNVIGFTTMAIVAMRYFLKQGAGHLVNFSSIAALRGHRRAPAYNASKAYESVYLEAMRHKVVKARLPITITDIQPGFVDTAMAKSDEKFWVASPDKAAEQIYRAIRGRKKHAYITRRWRLIAWLLKFVPDWFYNRI